jgi:hypothetical protein
MRNGFVEYFATAKPMPEEKGGSREGLRGVGGLSVARV